MIEDFRDRGIYLSEDEYRLGLRSLFSEDYQEYPDDVLEDILYNRIAQLNPSEAESFFNSVGDFFRRNVAPAAIAALPTVTTIAGTAIGGPVGAAVGGMAGNLASQAISRGTGIRPNQRVSNIAGAATSIAGGNIPGVARAPINIGNTVSPGAGNTIAGTAQTVQGVVPVAQTDATQTQTAVNTGASPQVTDSQTPAASQLLGFLNSAPFLQSILSAIATGNTSTGLQIPREDGSVTETNYVEMLEGLKYLAEGAIIEADNMGFSSGRYLESEADRDTYVESVIENVSAYENSLLPNYDNLQYN